MRQITRLYRTKKSNMLLLELISTTNQRKAWTASETCELNLLIFTLETLPSVLSSLCNNLISFLYLICFTMFISQMF